MGISENICTRQSLRRGDVRLAVALNKGEKLHKSHNSLLQADHTLERHFGGQA
jgi:hypothetical protein